MAEKKTSAETTVKNIRRRTRRKYSAEEKIRIVIEGLRGENTVAELCRREGINQNLYYKWSKEFLEAGKQRLAGNTKRQAGSNEVKELRRDMEQLKQLVAELALKNRALKKACLAWIRRGTKAHKRRRWRLSTWWSTRTSQSPEHWMSWTYLAAPSTAGTRSTRKRVTMGWQIPCLAHTSSGPHPRHRAGTSCADCAGTC